ncbi:MAG: hypothetical protein K2K13_01380 [Clostridiales bacterium]|nr:hypothetical protein [Clostridiales bacterium]
MIFAFIFDSGRLGSSFYGDVVFEAMLRGKEIMHNSSKMIVSLGDIIINQRVIDIEPYVIKDEYCSVNVCRNLEFKDYPFCWVIEDIDSEIARKLDIRLKEELDGYLGLTRIDFKSTDLRKQFWKKLIRDFSIENDTIISFNDPNVTDTFRYSESAVQLGYIVEYDKNAEYSLIEDCLSKQSTIVKKEQDLDVLSGKSDIDRDVMKLNFTLCRELQVAGALIWKSVTDIDKIKFSLSDLDNDNYTYLLEYPFMALYHASQGIERVQKIIVELIYKRDHIKQAEKAKVYELLMSHNHNALNTWIEEKVGIQFKNNNIKIISLLQKFYNEIRYVRFSDSNKFNSNAPEFELLLEFGDCKGQIGADFIVKNLFGKTLGVIAYTYYKLIYDLCGQINIYAYELDSFSAANFVFYLGDQAKNLYTELKHMQMSKKELLYWIMKNGKEYPKFAWAQADALEFDNEMIDEYMEELIFNPDDGQKLISDVNYLYDELCAANKFEWEHRNQLVDAVIGNPLAMIVDDDTFDD